MKKHEIKRKLKFIAKCHEIYTLKRENEKKTLEKIFKKNCIMTTTTKIFKFIAPIFLYDFNLIKLL